MRKCVLINVILILLILPIVNAELVVNLSTNNINTTVNSQQTIHGTFYNSFNYSIYKISLVGDDIFSMPLFNLTQNQTIMKDITITTHSDFSSDRLLRFYSYFTTNLSLNPQSYSVDLYRNYFYPSEISVIQGSNINFCNRDNSLPLLAIKRDDDSGWQNVYPQQCKNYVFSDNRSYDVFNSLGSKITIQVEPPNKEVLATNPSQDVLKNIFINSKYSNSVLSITLTPYNFSVNPSEYKEIAANIENIGNETIYNINLSGDWSSSFSKNNFNLTPSSSSIVTFRVYPKNLITEQTNKTYYKDLLINSLNSPQINKSMQIFVNFGEMNLSLEGGTYSDLLAIIQTLMDKLALYKSNISSNGSIVYREPSVDVTFTAADILAERAKNDLRDQKLADMDKKYTDNFDYLFRGMTILNAQGLNNTNMQKESVDTQKSQKNINWILFILLIMIIFIVVMSTLYQKIKKAKVTEMETQT